MRGSLVQVALILAALLPTGTAATVDAAGDTSGVAGDTTGLTGDTVDAAGDRLDAAAPEIRWFVPSAGHVGHPVHAAVGVYDGDRLVPDQSLRVTVIGGEGGTQELLFFSQEVHESDGFHPLVMTPHEAGMLTLRADFTHPTGASEATTQIPIETSPASDLVPYEPFRLEPTIQGDVADGHLAVWGRHHGIEHQALLDLHDDDGRLLVSHWPLPAGGHVSHLGTPIGGFGTGQLHALVTSHPSSDVTVFTETLTMDLDQPHNAVIRQPQLVTDTETCDDAGIALTTDPAPIATGGLVWHTDTNVRIAMATDEHLEGGFLPTESGRLSPTTAMYNLIGHDAAQEHTGTEGNSMMVLAADPFREVTFRVRDPGLYTLMVADHLFDGHDRCTLRFAIVANPATAAGTVAHEITVHDDRVRVELRSERDGDPLWGYAFDTRVVKHHTEDEPGRLVWKGKLHGVEGRVVFELGGLEPGDYEVRTYPSPERFGRAPVAAPTEDGFVYRFQVAGPVDPQPVITGTEPAPESVPTLGPLVTVALLAALAVRLRRR